MPCTVLACGDNVGAVAGIAAGRVWLGIALPPGAGPFRRCCEVWASAPDPNMVTTRAPRRTTAHTMRPAHNIRPDWSVGEDTDACRIAPSVQDPGPGALRRTSMMYFIVTSRLFPCWLLILA